MRIFIYANISVSPAFCHTPTHSKDPASRPTAQLLTLIKYFSDPAVHALQFLDVINMKDVSQKTNFYRVTLKDHLLYIPRVNF